MGERNAKTEPFQSGQQTNARDKGESTKVKFKMAKVRNAGQPDPLVQSLVSPPHIYADTVHFYSGTGGKPYQPEPWGKVQPNKNMTSKATNSMGGDGGKGTFRGRP